MRTSTRNSQDGQAVVIVAAIVVVLVILGALVFDVGLGMSDRRNLQAYADSAALAGARSYAPTSTQGAHWVAMQYLTGPLGFSLPTGSCSSSTTCPAATYTVSSIYTIQLADSTLPGWLYPTALDVVLTHQQPSIFSRIMGFTQLTIAASARAALPGPQRTGAAYALAAVSGDALINGGGAGFQTVTGPVYANGNFGGNNVPHSTGIPSAQTNYDGTICPGSPTNHVDLGGTSNTLNYNTTNGPPPATQNASVPAPTTFDNTPPTSAGPTYTTVGMAKDGLGNWKPGIYDGFAPAGGTMNGGVYKIINDTSSLALGSITNTVHTASGTSNGVNAVAIVLDSSDTATLDITSAVLNGLDDLYPAGYNGTATRDPARTHNFVIYGGNGAGGYSGAVTVGPGATTDLSGIIYLPKVAYTSDGNSSPKFTGAATFATMTVNGGGNGQQVFNWVCGLNAVQALGNGGGLIR